VQVDLWMPSTHRHSERLRERELHLSSFVSSSSGAKASLSDA
jgi:hypothetical protein